MTDERFLTRVWDKQEKKMIYAGKYLIDNDLIFVGIDAIHNQLIVADCEGNLIGWAMDNRFIPIQCTGLKDKNDKLIYEGDNLADLSEDKVNFVAYEVFFHDNNSCNNHIGFQMNRAHYHGNRVGGYVPCFKPETTSKMDIIGNKFETPELSEDVE